jgi:putative membrane protein
MPEKPPIDQIDVLPQPRPLVHVAQGLLMGAADSVPGVSGGTMALIVGIYERLLASIGTGFRAILALIKLDFKACFQRLREVEWMFLLPLAVGIGTAIIIAARFIPGLLEQYPRHMRGLFLGMVTASIAIPWKRIATVTRPLLLITVVAAIAAFVFSGVPPAGSATPSLARIFLSAAVAICAMILPGVSGAFLLEVLGMYEPTLQAVNDRDLVYVAVFGAGAIAGLGSFSLLLNALLRRRHDETMAALVGLMAGSLRALWPWQDHARSLSAPPSSADALSVGGIILAGFVAVLLIERVGARRAVHSSHES